MSWCGFLLFRKVLKEGEDPMRGILSGVVLMVLALSASQLQASPLPLLELEEGINEVSISVVNQGKVDLNSLAVVVDEENLPGWMRISESAQTICVRRRSNGSEKLTLSIEVRDAPQGACSELPLKLREVSGGEWSFKVLAKVASASPTSYALFPNVPNPFNPQTVIRYALVAREAVPTQLVIFNGLGQKVRTLVDEAQGGGFYSVVWDGRDDDGRFLSSGVYFYRLTAGEFVQVRKMILME